MRSNPRRQKDRWRPARPSSRTVGFLAAAAVLGVLMMTRAVPHVVASITGVRGWPHTAQNPAGRYSWDGHTCAGSSCVQGFMHNGYASGDVSIHVQRVSKARSAAQGTAAVTVVGHKGRYRRIDARTEEWIVGIKGTTLAIRLEARPGASKADLAEAHAIIKSMRTERRDTKLGFRLVFTLATDDWDSG